MVTFYIETRSAQNAIRTLVAAGEHIRAEDAARPRGGFASLTGIGPDVERFLNGIATARAALSDAAHTAGRGVRDLMESAAQLDQELASALDAELTVRR